MGIFYNKEAAPPVARGTLVGQQRVNNRRSSMRSRSSCFVIALLLIGGTFCEWSTAQNKRPLNLDDLVRIRTVDDPQVSPDGKWIIYCQAENFMNLMPDSRLYIVPVKGGTPRLLDCNLYAMNSWHAWSPNGKWIVFSSKGLSIFTDLFLAHIDEKGNASLPVLIDRAREYERVCNYPEFINRDPRNKFSMKYDYVELAHIKYALRDNDVEKAKQLFYKLIRQDPFMFSEDYSVLSGFLYRMDMKEEAMKYAELAGQSPKSNIAAD